MVQGPHLDSEQSLVLRLQGKQAEPLRGKLEELHQAVHARLALEESRHRGHRCSRYRYNKHKHTNSQNKGRLNILQT